MQLRDKRIIITGGASGIGASAVAEYVREGARVISLDVNDDLGMTVINEASEGATHLPVYMHCDVTDKDEVSSVFADAIESMGGLDVLAHVAGIERCTPAGVIDADEYHAIFTTNVWGTMSTNQAALQGMRDDGGAIINFSSGAGIQGLVGRGTYAASKGAVLGWTRTIAREWARWGIRVNAVAPAILTPMAEAATARLSERERALENRMLAVAIPLGGKLGDADRDMAPVMVFLASDASRFITGQTLCVDGGAVFLSWHTTRTGMP